MTQFIDRRANSRHKSAVNKQRFYRRFSKQIKKAVDKAINKRSITDIEKGDNISIPKSDTNEPDFKFGVGGIRSIILPGNIEFEKGDKIKRPPSGSQNSGNGEGGDGEEGTDEFAFSISQKDFLDIFFDDLELPYLIRSQIAKLSTTKVVRAGYSTTGVPTNINIVRSIREAFLRKVALSGQRKRNIADLEAKLADIQANKTVDKKQEQLLLTEIERLKKRLYKIPFIDPVDVRYNNKTRIIHPTTQAVMFCLMDVSGSMDETKKDIAKRFFILLYLFLKRNYDKTEVVFIRHHTSAKEVNEQEFFYSRETGGTVVSSALEMMANIIEDRYPSSEWNIYGAQASDGDNWNNDSPHCQKILTNKIMPHVQYFSYVEIMPRNHQSLWEVYRDVQGIHNNFAMQSINNISEIYPVFRELFKKQMQTS